MYVFNGDTHPIPVLVGSFLLSAKKEDRLRDPIQERSGDTRPPLCCRSIIMINYR